MARRQATDADLTVGTTVYKSKTSVKAWTVRYIGEADAHRLCRVYVLTPEGAGFAARNLWVEES